MDQERPGSAENYQILKFRSEEYPEDKYELMHPTLMTLGADLLILPDQELTGSQKQIAIPVCKQFMMQVIPYFQAQFNEQANWSETRSNDKILTVTTPADIDPLAVFAYVESVYDKNPETLTTNNCLDIFQLADFWCDDFMNRKARQFIEQNVNEDIFRRIVSNVSHAQLFGDIVEKVAKFAFLGKIYPKANDNLEAKTYVLWNVPEDQRSYSSINSGSPNYNKSILDTETGESWVPDAANALFSNSSVKNNWLLLDFQKVSFINGVALQCGYSVRILGYLRRFKLTFWSDGENEAYVDDGIEFTNPPVCSRSYNKIVFKNPIKARYLKLKPTYWTGELFVRIGVFRANE